MKQLIAIVAAGSLVGCTLVMPAALGTSASSHNAKVRKARPPGKERSVGAAVAVGVGLGLLVDVGIAAIIASQMEPFGDFGSGE